MPHSSQVREFRLSDRGIELLDVGLSSDGVLVGTARVSYENKQKAEELLRRQEIELKRRNLERRRKALENQIAELQAGFAAEEEDFQTLLAEDELRREALLKGREEIAASRQADDYSPTDDGSQFNSEG
jgi:circadian clock protein KaiC